MPSPQPGFIPAPSRNALFLVLRVLDPEKHGQSVARGAAGIPALGEKLGAADPRAKLVCTVSFGSEFWDVISPKQRPAGLRPFRAIAAQGRTAPSTGGDLLLHILSRRHDLNFELAMRLRNQLGDAVEVMDEVHGFQYLDSRDLTGFIDGTENPKGAGARARAALVGEEDPVFAGGSYVFTQRYVHDLRRWAALPRRPIAMKTKARNTKLRSTRFGWGSMRSRGTRTKFGCRISISSAARRWASNRTRVTRQPMSFS